MDHAVTDKIYYEKTKGDISNYSQNDTFTKIYRYKGSDFSC